MDFAWPVGGHGTSRPAREFRWPEAIPVIGDLIPADQRTLPVVVVSEINKKFGLPPEEAA
ncbi:MAG: hypothetical protein EBS87_11955 [Sphingomonadaceae bacterium]|nr:hypothetical protein [Sphingomonadaceae bacterium]